MQSKWKQTLVLGGIVLLLGVYFLVYENNRPSDEQIKTTQGEVTLFAGKTFDALELGSDSTLVRVEKKNNTWVITTPEEKDADNTLVESIIKQLSELKATMSINPTPPASAVNFGLDPVTKKIRIREVGATEYTEIAIGKENPLGTGVYIAVGKNPTIYSVPTSITSLAENTLESLRFKSPTPTATISNTPVPPVATATLSAITQPTNQVPTTPANGS